MPYFHLAAYSESLGSVTDSDVDAALDGVLVRRNNHLIFTDDYNLIAAYGSSTTLTRARFGNAALNQIGNPHIWPLDRSATISDLPAVMDFRDTPMELPKNEELTILATTDAVGPAVADVVIWLATPEWSQNLPGYRDRLITRATVVAPAGAESAWNTAAEVVMERDLYNGVYAVVGASCVAANAIAFRIRFPDQKQVRGKQHRPGGLVQNALGAEPWKAQFRGLGEWGRFHTFTLPEIQFFGDAAGGTYEVRLDLLYLGESPSLLYGG